MRISVLVDTALAFGAMPAVAQDPAREEPETFSFGSDTQEHVVQATECHPNTGVHLVAQNYGFFGIETVGAATVTCPVDLPHGGRVTGVECAMYDLFAAGDFLVQFVEYPIDATTGAPTVGNPIITLGTSGTPGYQIVTATPAAPVTVRRRNGNYRNVYVLLVNFPPTFAGNAAFRECVILWNRQVAPAPATATFTDVPVGHPQRQFIEALVAAGITGGCGAGTYCPDAPLTRGQMAVFLAVALGLHFPN